jgi:hypothetical protein
MVRYLTPYTVNMSRNADSVANVAKKRLQGEEKSRNMPSSNMHDYVFLTAFIDINHAKVVT